MKITAHRNIARSCLITLPLLKAITNHSSRYSWFVRWWEQRDLNPPQRISSGTAHVSGQVFRMQQVGAPVGHQLQQTHSSSFLCNWSPRYYQAILYSRISPIESVLSLSASTLSASQFLLAPLPSLITRFLPSTGTSLHGEQACHKHAIYESIGRFYAYNLAVSA